MGKQKGIRRFGIKYEYNGDGIYDTEQWNRSDKKYWTRWLKRLGKEELKEIIDENFYKTFEEI